jgi:hypothetical protein
MRDNLKILAKHLSFLENDLDMRRKSGKLLQSAWEAAGNLETDRGVYGDQIANIERDTFGLQIFDYGSSIVASLLSRPSQLHRETSHSIKNTIDTIPSIFEHSDGSVC